MSLGTTYSPESPWKGLQVTNFDQCLYIVMVIGKCKDVFRGIFGVGGGVENRGLYWWNFSWRNLSGGKQISMKGAQDFLALFKNKTIKK